MKMHLPNVRQNSGTGKTKTIRTPCAFCFNDPKEIRANLRFLGDEHDKCSSPTLKVFGQKTITVAKGGTARVDVGDRENDDEGKDLGKAAARQARHHGRASCTRAGPSAAMAHEQKRNR